jgi:hypothetical protein
MIRARRHALEFGARDAPDGDARRARQLDDFVQPSFVRALGDRDALDRAHTRAQSFEHRLDAEDVRAVGLRMMMMLRR